MRLIDADKIRYSDMSDGQVPGGLWYTFKETIDKTPTVEAIPIEWILNYRKNNQGEITYYTIDAIDHMLSEWCKLSSIDMWDMINGWEKENEID